MATAHDQEQGLVSSKWVHVLVHLNSDGDVVEVRTVNENDIVDSFNMIMGDVVDSQR